MAPDKDKKEVYETTNGGPNRASGEDTDVVAVDVGGKTGIGEGGVVESGGMVTTSDADEGKIIERDQKDKWTRRSGEG